MKLTSTQNTVRFSDIQRVAAQANEELQGSNPRPELVDFFQGGHSPQAAVYNNMKSLESLSSKVGQGQDPEVSELKKEVWGKTESRLKIVRYAALGTFAAVGLAFAGGLLHSNGLLDLGTVGQFLHQSTPYLVAAGTAVPVGFKAVATKIAEEPHRQLKYLNKMADIVERQREFQQQAAVNTAA